MTLFLIAKWLHVLSAAVLLGTGLGIAFFMFAAWRANNAAVFAGVARLVVLADWLFTASAVALQPLTGAALIHLSGRSWDEPWIVASLALYVFAGAFWLPVVWIQMRVAKLAASGEDVAQLRRLMWIWFWCGWPAFAAVLAIYALMIIKPA